MTYRFEDYAIHIGKLRDRPGYWASIEEFGSLVADGVTEEEARHKLRPKFDERVQWLQSRGEPLPLPGSGNAFLDLLQTIRLNSFVHWLLTFGSTF
jgi:predicted RNase H-like HicB family nuclease